MWNFFLQIQKRGIQKIHFKFFDHFESMKKYLQIHVTVCEYVGFSDASRSADPFLVLFCPSVDLEGLAGTQIESNWILIPGIRFVDSIQALVFELLVSWICLETWFLKYLFCGYVLEMFFSKNAPFVNKSCYLTILTVFSIPPPWSPPPNTPPPTHEYILKPPHQQHCNEINT